MLASGFPERMPVQPTMHRLPKALLELESGVVVVLYDRTMQQCEAIRLGEVIGAIIRLSFAGFHSQPGPFLISYVRVKTCMPEQLAQFLLCKQSHTFRRQALRSRRSIPKTPPLCQDVALTARTSKETLVDMSEPSRLRMVHLLKGFDFDARGMGSRLESGKQFASGIENLSDARAVVSISILAEVCLRPDFR